jgi:farnesyl diphosphate synthase
LTVKIDQTAFHAAVDASRARVEAYLDHCLPKADIHPARLHEAMRYAVFNGGKRFRPFLVYAAGKALGVPPESLNAPAAAVELIHAYSLVHDDLPAMDDDDLRRGKPTCHKAYDEATAILAGDALQTQAFSILARDRTLPVTAERRLEMMQRLAFASGSRGMAGGQAIDLESEGKDLDIAQIEDMHIHKTGALIRASVMLGALGQEQVDAGQLQRLDHYAKCVGLAFQIHDDILDVTADTATLGKPQGADMARDKSTYPSLIGLEASRERARELVTDALDSLAGLGDEAMELRWIALYAIERRH